MIWTKLNKNAWKTALELKSAIGVESLIINENSTLTIEIDDLYYLYLIGLNYVYMAFNEKVVIDRYLQSDKKSLSKLFSKQTTSIGESLNTPISYLDILDVL